MLDGTTQTIAWVVIFFFASAGASSAYLTVSEIFPMETRALAIAFFYAVGTGLGGIIGPVLFGNLISTKRASEWLSATARRRAHVPRRVGRGRPRGRRGEAEPRGHCLAGFRRRGRHTGRNGHEQLGTDDP